VTRRLRRWFWRRRLRRLTSCIDFARFDPKLSRAIDQALARLEEA
jgi:hypothetical protein